MNRRTCLRFLSLAPLVGPTVVEARWPGGGDVYEVPILLS